jgi:hypothetical protein
LTHVLDLRHCLFFRYPFLAAAFLVLAPLTSCSSPKPPLLSGQLNVLVRPRDRTSEPISIDNPGALPVQSSGAMCLDVQLNQPAYIYLVWIDASGKFIPLYPWNNETLDVTDIDTPPPERRPGKLIFSPLLGKSWTFGEKPGSETVLLLARTAPLPKDGHLGEILKRLPEPPALEPSEILATLHSTKPLGSTKGLAEGNARLAAFVQPLNDHFDLVQAVQFAHAAESEGKLQPAAASTPSK